MKKKWRTITIFISSTFSDMQGERDYLKYFVFPSVEDELKKNAVKLRIIDLRWGVNTLDTTMNENEVESEILRVCFDEIDRSRPFFLGLLGERYGWVPTSTATREISNKYKISNKQSITSMEIEYAMLNNLQPLNCIFFERHPDSYEKIDDNHRELYQESEQTNADKLNQLKLSVKEHLAKINKSHNYQTYNVIWNDGKFANFEDFGEKVRVLLLNEIKEYIQEYANEIETLKAVNDRTAQEEFLHRYSEILIERDIFKDIQNKLTNENNGIILTGKPGQGKSSTYTYLVRSLTKLPPDNFLVLFHSTRANNSSVKIPEMLKRWNCEIESFLSIKHNNDLQDVAQNKNYFHTLLKKIPSSIKVILLIDSLEGFVNDETAKYLTFFPRYEFRDLSIFCTCNFGVEKYAVEFNNKLKAISLPDFSKEEAKRLIDLFVLFYGKELHKEVENSLLNKEINKEHAYQSPFWLSLALSILVNINQNDFEQIKKINLVDEKDKEEIKIKQFLNQLVMDMPFTDKELFLFFIQKLKTIYGDFPKDIFEYISCGFQGLRESDLQILLKEKWDSRKFALIRSFFNLYLIECGDEKQWNISHQLIKECFNFSKGGEIHTTICNLFLSKCTSDEAKFNSEILYYLYLSNQYEKTFYFLDSIKEENEITKVVDNILELCNKIKLEEFVDFIDKCFAINDLSFIKRILAIGKLKSLIYHFCDELIYRGEYEGAVLLSDFFLRKLKESKIPKELRTIIYIINVSKKVNAVGYMRDTKAEIHLYENIIQELKITGLISLLLTPISKKYHKWQLHKLKK